MDADQDNSNACTTTSVESRDDGVLSPSNAEDNTLSASLNVDQDSNASAAAAANSVVDDVGSPSDNANIQDDQVQSKLIRSLDVYTKTKKFAPLSYQSVQKSPHFEL
ncbi:unnamed protein product [Mucor fragilis]